VTGPRIMKFMAAYFKTICAPLVGVRPMLHPDRTVQ